MNGDYFTKGECADEVVLIFDDDQKLYVSESFLNYASPMFKAMFDRNWKEKSTREVRLYGKRYEDFREFLLCLHPGVQKAVDRENIPMMAALAEEYQVVSVVKKIKQTMQELLKVSTDHFCEDCSIANMCLELLHHAINYRYEEIQKLAIEKAACYHYQIFTGTRQSSVDVQKEELTACNTLFNKLDGEIKSKLLMARLEKVDRR